MNHTRVKLYFDNPIGQYSPGESISGKVILLLEKGKPIIGIDMNLIGKCKVNCLNTNMENMPNHRRSLSIRSGCSDKYFIIKESKTLNRGSGDSHFLYTGTYEYPFTWTLPENIPASFEGPCGWVRYRMEVVVRYSFWDHRCQAESTFLVTGKYALNNLTKTFREVTVENKWIHMVNESLLDVVYLELTFELERRAYVPGETIKFAATPYLQCHGGFQPINGVRVALVQEQTYKIKDKVRRHTMLCQETHGPHVFCNEIEVWNGSLDILPVPPTGLGGECRLIDIQYFLKVRIKITDKDKIDFCIKLQIGTIPLRRRRPRGFSGSDSPQRQLSIELPQTPNSRSPERNSPNVRGQAGDIIPPSMDYLNVMPGPSRRASAPPLWLEAFTVNVPDNLPNTSSAVPNNLGATSSTVEPDTPPPAYSEAVFFESVGFLGSTGAANTNGNADDPPEYSRPPPYFLQKGAKHLFDNYNAYSTL